VCERCLRARTCGPSQPYRYRYAVVNDRRVIRRAADAQDHQDHRLPPKKQWVHQPPRGLVRADFFMLRCVRVRGPIAGWSHTHPPLKARRHRRPLHRRRSLANRGVAFRAPRVQDSMSRFQHASTVREHVAGMAAPKRHADQDKRERMLAVPARTRGVRPAGAVPSVRR